MPVPVSEIELAATIGSDVKRGCARRNVAREFFQTYIFDADKEPDYRVVRRAMQVIDFSQPVLIGPPPAGPRRLAAVSPKGGLGEGFFAEVPPSGMPPEYWLFTPDAVYLKFYQPIVWSKADTANKMGEARYFFPGARNPQGKRVATRDRS
ncbi:MAG TPA: hypothetical protein VL400_08065 [Polyangiaceae bacterium]|nr:hypothetical protein [Polyangiaceae bacterium]